MTKESYEARIERESQEKQLKDLQRKDKLDAAQMDEENLLKIVNGKSGVQLEKWQFGINSSIVPSSLTSTWEIISRERPMAVGGQLLQDFDVYILCG